ncbi:mediator of RNA polymerase II transcription subunit 30-like [Acanthaster planci]|uniref:Mediator of RNA polymerase II transcription subunit 30 n=1 Tax=Acanthaster planci TaxID=133434 RepID=A0A8B7ZD48_ACAPL|nr:mediator of RNA polymerase II transcription subunit 30-like [Acanthaster planci]
MAAPTQQSGASGGNQNPTSNPTMSGARSEITCVSLYCRLGQETVQEIVAKTNEIFGVMKSMQLPNGVSPVNPAHQAKLQDLIRNSQRHFKRLRLLYDKCNQLSGGMDQSNAEELIPWKDGQDSLSDLSGLGSEDKVMNAKRERQELMEKVQSKNEQLRQVIERLRALIWDINTMMAMRYAPWP